MTDPLAELMPDPRRVLDWLPAEGVWRELWFVYRPAMGAVPEEPILADLEAAIAAGWAEDSGLTFDFNDDAREDGARSMRAYRTTPVGLLVKSGRLHRTDAGRPCGADARGDAASASPSDRPNPGDARSPAG